MGNYLYLYRGPATPMAELTTEQGEEQARLWNSWIARTGSALVDVGSPCGTRTAVVDDGTSVEPSDQNGYSIVRADTLEAAKDLVREHPFLAEGKGRFAVEIFELLPM